MLWFPGKQIIYEILELSQFSFVITDIKCLIAEKPLSITS